MSLLDTINNQESKLSDKLSVNKLEGGKSFKITSNFSPAGDQPAAIKELCSGLVSNEKNQVLLGVTGSGKTFTMAKIIETLNRPAIILAPNKTLAAQLYGEMKSFFSNNSVEYFVSYYDYYTPEAYVPRSDTYIEKESSINEQIDRMRHSATRSLLEKDDVIIVSSVSCIYGLGSAESYSKMTFTFIKNENYEREEVIKGLIELQYKRNDQNFQRGTFRVRGENIEIFPSHLEDRAWKLNLDEGKLISIKEFDPLTGDKTEDLNIIKVYANSHYITPRPTVNQAIKDIREELKITIEKFRSENKLLEAQRIEERTRFDLEMIEATGSCSGIENYSRYLDGRAPGTRPFCLLDYFPDDYLMIVDESHVTIPQVHAMYGGDRSRKENLVTYGFRLPAAMDNRPLKFEEFENLQNQVIYVSATPADYELRLCEGIFVEQIIRPTGLLDPIIEVRPTKNQIDDLVEEIRKREELDERVLVTTLTKRMAEELTKYLTRIGVRCRYIHSDVDTLERVEIMQDLRKGLFDVLIGVNLLREGLDLPEVSLVAIVDADKEGFLRSNRSLTQTVGRAARNVNGKAIMYADNVTDSMQSTINQTSYRREKQMEYNQINNAVPTALHKKIETALDRLINSSKPENELSVPEKEEDMAYLLPHEIEEMIKKKRKQMQKAAQDLDFMQAAKLRDQIKELEVQKKS